MALPVVAIFGPTSAGKTGLSLDLAQGLRQDLGVEPVIISADSRQVYKFLDIGTSKIAATQMRGIPHEMLDVADPVRKFELEAYARMARDRIDECRRTGRLPIIVGGTGVYVQSLLEGWELNGASSLRRSLSRDFPLGQAADAHRMLHRLDPRAARSLHPNNHEAVINALVRALAPQQRIDGRPETWVTLGIDPGARAIERGIRRTFDEQVARGLLDEVRSLARRYDLENEMKRRGRQSQNQVLHTHGYREYFEVAAERRVPVAALGATDLGRAREMALEHIRAYSRHQRGWFRKLAGVRMVRTAGEAQRRVIDVLRREATAPAAAVPQDRSPGRGSPGA
jgi:tRNA dimethylallyltransferase